MKQYIFMFEFMDGLVKCAQNTGGKNLPEEIGTNRIPFLGQLYEFSQHNFV